MFFFINLFFLGCQAYVHRAVYSILLLVYYCCGVCRDIPIFMNDNGNMALFFSHVGDLWLFLII